jgi:hypothetical protein
VFLFIKSYASWLVAELSQLCYKGVLRTIALGSTDGLCTWRVPFVGSIIDRYMELSLSSQFNTTIPIAINII